MSRLWPDRLILGIAPDRLSAIQLTRGWRPTVRTRLSLSLDLTEANDWHPAMEALPAFLAPLAAQPATTDVILSNHWVHYAILPAATGLRGRQEQQALAALVFAERFDTTSRDWILRWSPAARGRSTLASGVPAELLTALRAAIPSSLRLRSCQPALMAAINRRRASIKDDAVEALIEPGRITLLHGRQAQWSNVISRRIGDDAPGDLVRLLGEFAALGSIPTGTPLWLNDLTGTQTLPSGTAWQVEPVANGQRQLADLGVGVA